MFACISRFRLNLEQNLIFSPKDLNISFFARWYNNFLEECTCCYESCGSISYFSNSFMHRSVSRKTFIVEEILAKINYTNLQMYFLLQIYGLSIFIQLLHSSKLISATRIRFFLYKKTMKGV